MKNRTLIKKIVKMADKLDNINTINMREWAYKGYELACTLSQDYDGRVTPLNALAYSRWLYGVTMLLTELEIIQNYL